MKVLLIGKVQCVYNSKLFALETNTIKSYGRANRNKEIRHGSTMHKTLNMRPLKQSSS